MGVCPTGRPSTDPVPGPSCTLRGREESEVLFREFLKQNIDEPKKEFYVPSVVSKMIQEGMATVKVLDTPSTWFGVTYKEDRAKVVARLKEMADDGIYPSPLF